MSMWNNKKTNLAHANFSRSIVIIPIHFEPAVTFFEKFFDIRSDIYEDPFKFNSIQFNKKNTLVIVDKMQCDEVSLKKIQYLALNNFLLTFENISKASRHAVECGGTIKYNDASLCSIEIADTGITMNLLTSSCNSPNEIVTNMLSTVKSIDTNVRLCNYLV
jgi:predicted enzyme related to lactoylglutathione lyase